MVDPATGLSTGLSTGLAAGLVAGLLMLAGCAATGASDGVNNGLATMDPGSAGEADDPEGLGANGIQPDIDEGILRSMQGLSELFGAGGALDGAEDATTSRALDTAGAEVNSDDPAESLETTAVAEAEDAEPEPSPEARAHALAAQLESALRETTDDPYALAIRLAGLLAGEPDAATRLNAMVERLPVDQRGVVRAVVSILGEAGTDPASMTEALVARADELDEARPVRIGQLAMCSRVEGFGRYTELPSTGFVAGTPMRMIIYTEVEHFNRTEIGRSSGSNYSGNGSGLAIEDGWEVRLSQELQLYHEADGLLAWRRPEEVTAYRSRSKPRDYFIVDQIQLPRTLTVGAYRLKVVLRDLADRSVDERLIPIRVVADPALTTGSSTVFGG